MSYLKKIQLFTVTFIFLFLFLFISGSNIFAADEDCGFKAHDGENLVTFACEPSGSTTSPLRIYTNYAVRGIVLVDTDHLRATKFWIKTPAGVKALKEFAQFSPCNTPWGVAMEHEDSVIAYQSSSVPCGSTCSSETRTCNDGTLSGTYTSQDCSVSACTSCTTEWGTTIEHTESVTAYQSSSVPCGSTCSSQTRTCNDGTLSGTYTNQNCSVTACASCSTVARSWSNCSASFSSVNHGQTRTSTNTVGGYDGSATYSCNNGTWSYQSGTCNAITCKSISGYPSLSVNGTSIYDSYFNVWFDLDGTYTYKALGGPFPWTAYSNIVRLAKHQLYYQGYFVYNATHSRWTLMLTIWGDPGDGSNYQITNRMYVNYNCSSTSMPSAGWQDDSLANYTIYSNPTVN